MKLDSIAACVFEACGILFDPSSVVRAAHNALGDRRQPPRHR